jgi:ribosomal protein S18 acetylase RimI-like enzyme
MKKTKLRYESILTSFGSLLRLRATQASQAAQMLARAFHGDPLYAFIIPDSDERERLLPHIFGFRIRYGILYGEVHATSMNLEGVAVWVPSEKVDITWWRGLQAGGFSLYREVGKRVVSKLNEIQDYSLSIHRRHTSFRHWHLSPIAVDPCYQGKGYARSLMSAMLTRLDQEGLPCFLETQSERNVSIYKRYGFAVVERGLIPGSSIPHWAMLRLVDSRHSP